MTSVKIHQDQQSDQETRKENLYDDCNSDYLDLDDEKDKRYTDYQQREREKVKSPFREMKNKRKKSNRICSVPGCTNRVADGLRFLCSTHYAKGGDNAW